MNTTRLCKGQIKLCLHLQCGINYQPIVSGATAPGVPVLEFLASNIPDTKNISVSGSDTSKTHPTSQNIRHLSTLKITNCAHPDTSWSDNNNKDLPITRTCDTSNNKDLPITRTFDTSNSIITKKNYIWPQNC